LLLAPVSWELVEPTEGRFDFALVDGVIQGARASGMKLVLLWFGSWKNSMSSYAPAWIKTDQERFPRAETYAVGEHDAIGVSPFSLESIRSPADTVLARSYALLQSLAPLILEHQGGGTIVGVRPPVAFDGTVDASPREVALGDYTLTVSFRDPWVAEQRIAEHGGLIIALAPDEFVIAGTGLTVTFAPRTPGDPIAGLLTVDEGRFEDGRWVAGRRLNGDQTHQGRHVRLPSGEFGVQRVRLYRYQ
jgi:beta-galactosidase GanA